MTTETSSEAVSNIQWNHIDGPLFNGKDGYVHWLTIMEILMVRIGLTTIADLEVKYNHNDRKG